MSVIVKGVSVPKNCYTCAKYRWSPLCPCWCGDAKASYYRTSRHPDCPFVEVPTPHGRLGDLDKLWDRMYNYTDNEGAKMPFGDNDSMIHRDSACELVEDAPTIIEGSET